MRYNIFNQIHKALRALLYDTALTLQQTHFANPDEAELALEKLKLTLDMFDRHAHHEDTFVLPVIQQYEPALVDAFEQEHVQDHALAEKLRALMVTSDKAKTSQDQIIAGQQILVTFIEFMTFNLEHMAKEEKVLNERLWRFYSDKELMAISQAIVESLPGDEVAINSKWIMRGLSNAEITAWLKAVQTNAPEAVFNSLFVIAEKELPYQRFRKILEDLTEGAMIA